MSPLIFALPENEDLAYRLANLLGGCNGVIEVRQFPDGETYIRFCDDPKGRDVVLVCTLDRPDSKVMPLFFAAEAARDLGASGVGLVAPYLCYMRQDQRFERGEAVTSRSFAKLLSDRFDWLVTVDPHLHRFKSLADIYSIPAKALQAAPTIAEWVKKNVEKPYFVGPDTESRQWVEMVAAICGASWTIAKKTREGDRMVHEELLSAFIPRNATPVLLDDIISSGATLLEALRLVQRSSAQPPIAVAIHRLCDAEAEAAIVATGARLVTTNTVPNPSAQVDLLPLIAKGVLDFLTPSTGNHRIAK